MKYFPRQLEATLETIFRGKSREGVLLPGVVGCGKTTLIQHLLGTLRDEFDCFSFTGDETRFRANVTRSGTWILDEVKARTNRKALVFVDEVQKEEAIFDALKIAFDRGEISFIVSGSNPEYIRTRAAKRLQRRARLIEMHPFSCSEVLVGEGLVGESEANRWRDSWRRLLFDSSELPAEAALPSFGVSDEIRESLDRYLVRGGFPLAWMSPTNIEAFDEIKKVFERGFEPILRDTTDVSNIVAESLALNHSREFTYQGIMQRTKLSHRRHIVDALNALKAHGYLHVKSPWFPAMDHSSYINVYSYCDPGIVSYLEGTLTLDQIDKGPRVEGVCHTRLRQECLLRPARTHLDFYKPFTVSGKSVRFRGGEIDFVVRCGKRVVPIEVKAGTSVKADDLDVLATFVREHELPFGIVLYGGLPRVDDRRRLVFWPWFLV